MAAARDPIGALGVVIRHRHGWEDGKVRAVGALYEIRHTMGFRSERGRR